MRKFFHEFKVFISRGNVFDMAVGLIIATAFNKIVSSLVNDIIMPLITWATGAASLADLSIVLKRASDGTPTLTWAYGNFIQTVIDFLIIAFSVFCMVKIITRSQAKFRELGEIVVAQNKKEVKEEKKRIREQAKVENTSFRKLWKEHKAEKKRIDDERKARELEEKRKRESLPHPTQEQLLTEIRDLLREKNAPKPKDPKEEPKEHKKGPKEDIEPKSHDRESVEPRPHEKGPKESEKDKKEPKENTEPKDLEPKE